MISMSGRTDFSRIGTPATLLGMLGAKIVLWECGILFLALSWMVCASAAKKVVTGKITCL